MKNLIYQILPRLWGDGRLSSVDDSSLSYLKNLGIDYVWYTGIPRHSSGKDFVKGCPGSPYSITDWKDINPYLADNPDRRMEEFSSLIERTHRTGMKCIIDYIPNHVAKDYKGELAHFDWCDYDWTDTLKVNWQDPRTLPAALDILRFWASKGVDGFRCDMVELVPQEALKILIQKIKEEFPDLMFIAEVYGKDNYRQYLDYVGFDLLYDKSGAYDALRAIICSGESARRLSWNWQWLQGMQPGMLNFLENHDEQRLSSAYFAGSPDRGWAALAFSLLFNTASFMVYFGQEAGESAEEGHEGRTSIFNWCKPQAVGRLWEHIHGGNGLDAKEAQVLERYASLLRLSKEEVFSEGKCWDLVYCQPEGQAFNPDRHFAFLRYDDRDARLVVCNFDCNPLDCEISIPSEPLGKELSIKIKAAAFDSAIISLNSI